MCLYIYTPVIRRLVSKVAICVLLSKQAKCRAIPITRILYACCLKKVLWMKRKNTKFYPSLKRLFYSDFLFLFFSLLIKRYFKNIRSFFSDLSHNAKELVNREKEKKKFILFFLSEPITCKLWNNFQVKIELRTFERINISRDSVLSTIRCRWDYAWWIFI